MVHFSWFKIAFWINAFYANFGTALTFISVLGYYYNQLHDEQKLDALQSGQGVPTWTIGIAISASFCLMIDKAIHCVEANVPGAWFSFLASVSYMAWTWMLWFGLCDMCASGAYSPSILYISYWFLVAAMGFAGLAAFFYKIWGTDALAEGETLSLRCSTMYRRKVEKVSQADAQQLLEMQRQAPQQLVMVDAAVLSNT
jgi:hypothetical protein